MRGSWWLLCDPGEAGGSPAELAEARRNDRHNIITPPLVHIPCHMLPLHSSALPHTQPRLTCLLPPLERELCQVERSGTLAVSPPSTPFPLPGEVPWVMVCEVIRHHEDIKAEYDEGFAPLKTRAGRVLVSSASLWLPCINLMKPCARSRS